MFEQEMEQLAQAASIAKAANDDLIELQKSGGMNTAEVAEAIRKEMKITFDAYRQEMEKNFQDHKKRMRIEAFWQWVICAALVVAALIREANFWS